MRELLKIKKNILLICIIVSGPFVALSCLILMNSVNPMQLAFLTSFKVENQSGQDVRITPIGSVGANGRKKHLPIYMTAFPAFPAVKTGKFHLKNGQTIKIRYDWDDINFSEIAIASKHDQFYQLVIDSNPTENQYHPPQTKHFVIPALETLPSMQPNVYEASMKLDRRWGQHLLIVGSAVLLVMFWRMVVQYRKEKSDSPKVRDG
jgi:hypothetical protein